MKRPDFTVGDYVRYDERYHCVSKVNAIKYNKAMQCYEATLNNLRNYTEAEIVLREVIKLD